MSCKVPCNMLGNTATLSDGTDSGKTRVVGYRENSAVFAQPPVFVDDALRYVKHTDVGRIVDIAETHTVQMCRQLFGLGGRLVHLSNRTIKYHLILK